MSLLNAVVDFINNRILRNTPEEQIKREIKQLKKSLAKSKFNLLESRTEFLTRDFADYLYRIYRKLCGLLGNLKIDMVTKQGAPFKIYLINTIGSTLQEEILVEFAEENLMRKIANSEKEEFLEYFQTRVKDFYAMFQTNEVGRISGIYNQIKLLGELAKFDFYVFFREFDSSFKDNDPTYFPAFYPKDGKYFLDDLKTLDQIFNSIVFDNTLLKNLKIYFEFKGKELLNEVDAKETFKLINQTKKMHIFPTLIKILQKDLGYETNFISSNENILTDYLQKVVEEWQITIRKVFNVMSIRKVNSIKDKLFADSKIPPLHFYTEQRNQMFEKAGIKKYLYVNELFATKAFLIEKYEKYIGEYINKIIVSGKFTDFNIQKSLSDNYYMLNEMRQRILTFDNRIGDDGDVGKKINSMIPKVAKEKTAKTLIEEIIDEANKTSKEIIFDTIKNLKEVMHFSKHLIQDHQKSVKNTLQNIMDFDHANTIQVIAKFKNIQNDILLYLNIIKEYSKNS